MKLKNGFTTLELTFLIIVITAAFLAMQVYFKRAVMGKWKAAADSIGFGRQY